MEHYLKVVKTSSSHAVKGMFNFPMTFLLLISRLMESTRKDLNRELFILLLVTNKNK